MQNNYNTKDEIVNFLNIAHWKFSREDVDDILKDLKRKIISDFKNFSRDQPQNSEWNIYWNRQTLIQKLRIINLYIFQSFQRILRNNRHLNFEVKKRMLITYGSTSDKNQLQEVKRIQQIGQPDRQQINQIDAKIFELKRILQDFNYIRNEVRPIEDRIQKFLKLRKDNKDDIKFLGPTQLDILTTEEKNSFLKFQNIKITQIINNLKRCNNLTKKTFGKDRVPKYVVPQQQAP